MPRRYRRWSSRDWHSDSDSRASVQCSSDVRKNTGAPVRHASVSRRFYSKRHHSRKYDSQSPQENS